MQHSLKRTITYNISMEALFVEVLERSGATTDDIREKIPATLDYEEALRLALDVGAQLEAAETEGKGYISVGPDNIRRMGSGSYLFVDNAPYDIVSGELKITKPFDYTPDMAPELSSVSRLPASVSPSAGYYSLAKSVVSLLGIGDDVERLRPTKLYYPVKRANEEDPKDRYFLYI